LTYRGRTIYNKKELNMSLLREAEGIGPVKPGNLVQYRAQMVLNPTECFILKDEERFNV